MSEDSSSDGREDVTDKDLLDILQQAESPVLATSEIVDLDEITVTQGQVLKRLRSLEEKDRVGSKIYSGKPQVRLWWHGSVDMKKAWPSNDELTDKIGVEVVDVLEGLPGRGETLRKRREAINAVFKYLFDSESGSKGDMHLVGWGVDMDTYEGPDNLWNNCLKPALDQSPFFTLYKSEKEWQLSELGSEVKQMNDRGLWNDWDKHKKKLDERYHSVVWRLFSEDVPFEIDHQRSISSVPTKFHKGEPEFFSELDMDGPVWSCSTGRFHFGLVLHDDPENLELILDNKDNLTSNFETDVQWKNHIKDGALKLRCSHSIDIDASRMLQQREKEYDDVTRQLKQLVNWVDETREQLSTITQEVNRLVESNN